MNNSAALSTSGFTRNDARWKAFAYDGGQFVVEVKLSDASRVTPTSLALLQVLADVVHSAAQRSGLTLDVAPPPLLDRQVDVGSD